MKNILRKLERLRAHCGSWEKAAKALGYTSRQLLNIRKAIQAGSGVSDRVARNIVRETDHILGSTTAVNAHSLHPREATP